MRDPGTVLGHSGWPILKHDPKSPNWDKRDILVLSNGHCVPVRYASMAEAGYFPKAELLTLRKFGSRLQGHPERTRLPGMETTSGPLGSGLSQAVGMALGLRMDKQKGRWVYVVMSDGEQDFQWHGKPPDHQQAKIALHELRTLGGKIRSEHE
jgi:transketolase N-terminal domain/subunit